MKTMHEWFYMREGFTTFRLDPERHGQLVFGHEDRRKRDLLIGNIEEGCYSAEGNKAAVFGDYGRGKTHLCHNLALEVRRIGLNVVPLYVKCSAYTAKEPFSGFFHELVKAFPTEELNAVADEYARRAKAGTARPMAEVVRNEDIALVLTRGLGAPNPDLVRTSTWWLGGQPKVNLGELGSALTPQLKDSQEFGAVMRGIVELYLVVKERVPLFFIDEAERFQNVTHADTYWKWLAALRELTEINNLGLIFMIGAKNRNDIPAIFLAPELMRRIGMANYIELTNPAREDLRSFLIELLQTIIRKGEVPEAHRKLVDPKALDAKVPKDLQKIAEEDERALESYPFEPNAFDELIEQLNRGQSTNKPSEMLVRLQKCAQRAMREDRKRITKKIVEGIESEGM